MNLRILIPVLAVLFLTDCTESTVTPAPVPEVSPTDGPLIQAAPATPDANLPTSTPSPSPTPKVTSTIVPYPILLNTPTPIPAPTATPTSVPIPGTPASPAPVDGPPPSHPTPKAFTTPAPPPPPTHQDPARDDNPEPENPPQGGGSQEQPAFGTWLPPVDCSGEDATFSASPVDVENLWYIAPQGKLHGGHVTSTEHTYFVHNKLRDYEMQANTVR